MSDTIVNRILNPCMATCENTAGEVRRFANKPRNVDYVIEAGMDKIDTELLKTVDSLGED
jgi:hypothetical protein